MGDDQATADDGGTPFRGDSAADRAFRLEVRAWIEENLPADLKGVVLRPDPEAYRRWHRLLYARGWAAPNWPEDAGGMGASVRQQLILVEEMVRAGAPYLVTVGISFVGPTLIEFGTDAQKSRHLPPILSGDVAWAQGYSEVGAGSDLASLKTRATPAPGGFRVTGHKVWQTWGHYSDWMFTLVRTDAGAPKHRGISCLMIDLASPGVTVRPIVTITGEDELSEVFLDDVTVPKENLVGPLNEGWRVANALLARERLAGSNPLFSLAAYRRAERIAHLTGAIEDAAFRDRLAAARLRVLALEAAFEHAVRCEEAGALRQPDSSVLKFMATETVQAMSDLMVEAAGAHGADLLDAGGAGDTPQAAAAHFLQSRRATIFGGTREIQMDIVARRLLGLP